MTLALAPTILRQLLRNRGKQGFVHESRHGNGHAFGQGRVIGRVSIPRLQGPAALRTQSGSHRPDARLAELGLAPVGRVVEDAPDRRAIPVVLAAGAADVLLL